MTGYHPYRILAVLKHEHGPAEVTNTFVFSATSARGAAFQLESLSEATRKGFFCTDSLERRWPDDTRAIRVGDDVIATPMRGYGGVGRRSIRLTRTEGGWNYSDKPITASRRHVA